MSPDPPSGSPITEVKMMVSPIPSRIQPPKSELKRNLKKLFIFFLLENNWVRLIYPIYSNLQPVEKLTVNAIRTELSSIRDPPFYESQFFHRP